MLRRGLRAVLISLLLAAAAAPLARADVGQDLMRAILRNDIPAVFRLVQAGADLNFRSRTGNTPLHEAAALGHRDIVQILVDGGASASMKNAAGYTPLDWARRRGYPEIAELIETALARRGPSQVEIDRRRIAEEQAAAPAAPPAPQPDDFLSAADRREVQADLRALGLYDGAIDGLIGPQSRRAVAAWQARSGLEATGRLDPQQYARLRIEAAAARAAPEAGAAGGDLLATLPPDDVAALEDDLVLLGFDPGPVDGVADAALARGLAAWRAAEGGPAEGEIGIADYAAIKRAARERREAEIRAAARREAEAALQASLSAGPETPAAATAAALREKAQADIAAERRVALVIGNAAYAHVPPLANPRNDAADVAAMLAALNFEVLTVLDGDLEAMRDGLRDFAVAASGADIAMLYYAGHGVQVNGENFLLPVSADVERQIDLEFEAMSLDQVLGIMNRSEAGLKLLMLDACRDNPLPRSLARSVSGRGLARIEAGAVGTYIAFATSPGAVASDGTGRNSPFTAALLRHLPAPNVEVGEMFRNVRRTVLTETGGAQLPWSHDSVVGSFYFGGRF